MHASRQIAAGSAALLLCAVAAGCRSETREAALAPRGAATAAGPALVDVAADVGLDFRHGAFRRGVSADAPAMMGGGLCWLDYDDDGWLDLFVVDTWSQDERDEWAKALDLVTRLPDRSWHRYTYAEFAPRARRLAAALRKELGLQDGDRVGTFCWNH